MSCQHRHDGAAYVLGALDPVDRSRFDAHLPGCSACTATVRHMTELPGVLAHVPVEELLRQPTPPPAAILSGLFAQLRKDRQRHRLRTAFVTAAAVVLVTVAAVVTVESLQPETAAVTTPVAVSAQFEPVDGIDIWGEAKLMALPEGTQIKVDCIYGVDGEISYGELPYRLIVTNKTGDTDVAGSWHADNGTSEEVTLFTRWEPQNIKALEIQDLDGAAILRWQR
jgi:hypothetical protein